MKMMTMTIIVEWIIMLLFSTEERTLLLPSVKPDYQLALAVQILLCRISVVDAAELIIKMSIGRIVS